MGAASKVEEKYDALDRQLKGHASIRQTLVRAYQVRKAFFGLNLNANHDAHDQQLKGHTSARQSLMGAYQVQMALLVCASTSCCAKDMSGVSTCCL